MNCGKPFGGTTSATFCSEDCAFWNKVEKGKDCWLWTGFCKANGHGQFNFRYTKDKAHRVSWRLLRGAIPKGRLVLHSCQSPNCVNPNHLFLGSNKDKGANAARLGRTSHGSSHYKTSLTEDDVRAIRSSSERGVDLARRFGTTPVAISLIRSRKTWKHIT